MSYQPNSADTIAKICVLEVQQAGGWSKSVSTQRHWVPFLALPVMCWVNLAKLLELTVPLFPYFESCHNDTDVLCHSLMKSEKTDFFFLCLSLLFHGEVLGQKLNKLWQS